MVGSGTSGGDLPHIGGRGNRKNWGMYMGLEWKLEERAWGVGGVKVQLVCGH